MRIIVFENTIAENTVTYKTIAKKWLTAAFEEKYGARGFIKTSGSFFKIVNYARRSNALLFIPWKSKNLKFTGWLSNLYAKFLMHSFSADVLINFTAEVFDPSQLPQLIVISSSKDVDTVLQNPLIAQLYRTNFIVPLHAIKQLLIEKNSFPAFSIKVISPSKTTDIINREQSHQTNLTNGNDFFLASFNKIDKFIMLLKAFSLFKKWQQSNMYFMLAIKDEDILQEAKKKITSYKFASSIVFIKDASPYMQYCYAYVFTQLSDDIMLPLQIFHQTVAILPTTFQSLFSDVALYHANDAASISKAMIQLYKDENLHKSLIAKAHIFLNENSDEHPQQKLWSIVEHAVHSN